MPNGRNKWRGNFMGYSVRGEAARSSSSPADSLIASPFPPSWPLHILQRRSPEVKPTPPERAWDSFGAQIILLPAQTSHPFALPFEGIVEGSAARFSRSRRAQLFEFRSSA
jgi:hypothetical protein